MNLLNFESTSNSFTYFKKEENFLDKKVVKVRLVTKMRCRKTTVICLAFEIIKTVFT